ncbi:MAG: hypothetical protein KGV59_05445 [Tenacibaculum sp.]|nr:hypothetical protein [Tenacibaculum sp.]
MTILEAIKSNPIFSDISDGCFEFVLSNRSIDGAVTYSNSDLKDVELATADLYQQLITLSELKEGQLSVKYNIAELEKRAIQIYRKYNDGKAKDYELKPLNVGVTFE